MGQIGIHAAVVVFRFWIGLGLGLGLYCGFLILFIFDIFGPCRLRAVLARLGKQKSTR